VSDHLPQPPPPPLRSLAIDLGARRIGLALSDAGGRLASPHSVLESSDPDSAMGRIAEVARQEGAQRLVVGLPLNMDGTVGPAARAAMSFAQRLGAVSGLPVVLVDERLSSFAAEEQLGARRRAGERITRQRRRRQLDALAAADFLQAYLDGRLAAFDGDAAR
jgi:putative Holliday junction resolvase